MIVDQISTRLQTVHIIDKNNFGLQSSTMYLEAFSRRFLKTMSRVNFAISRKSRFDLHEHLGKFKNFYGVFATSIAGGKLCLS